MREERYYRKGEEYIRDLEKEIAFEDSLMNEEKRRARDKEHHERIRRAIDKAQHIQNASRFIIYQAEDPFRYRVSVGDECLATVKTIKY